MFVRWSSFPAKATTKLSGFLAVLTNFQTRIQSDRLIKFRLVGQAPQQPFADCLEQINGNFSKGLSRLTLVNVYIECKRDELLVYFQGFAVMTIDSLNINLYRLVRLPDFVKEYLAKC